jgi:hypothetical protein
MSGLLDALVAKSGLSPIFATRVIRRAVLRAGLDPESLQHRDIERLLPELRRAIAVYLGEEETREHVAAIRGLQSGG